MSNDKAQLLRQLQRVQVEMEGASPAQRLKISVENYDEGLGWYSAGSLSLPMHQVPLLEQALQALRAGPDEPESSSENTVIAFPGLRVAI